jgi:hypothetical protein
MYMAIRLISNIYFRMAVYCISLEKSRKFQILNLNHVRKRLYILDMVLIRVANVEKAIPSTLALSLSLAVSDQVELHCPGIVALINTN